MKKLLFLVILGLAALALSATRIPLAYLNTETLSAETSLRNHVATISGSGIDVYHYNENYLIAGVPEGTATRGYRWTYLPQSRQHDTLYLITIYKRSDLPALTGHGEILLDMGHEVLYSSSLSDVQLREKIKYPFTILDRTPMRISHTYNNENPIQQTRTEIQQLVSQVSADSVLFFIQALQDMQTRYALADNRLTVATWIKNQFQRFGITNAELFSFNWNNTTQYNVVATITGSIYPDQYIIVGGHHDSVTYTTPYVFAPGADDNASGTVAAIEMARVLANANYQPKCSIRFVTFAAEEFGLWGAKNYAQYALDNNMNIRLMINHDMIANNNNGGTGVRLMPYSGFENHTTQAALIMQQYTNLTPFFGTMNSGSSDSHPFWQRGYPVIYYFELDFCPYYHSDLDITANIDPVYCAEVIRASLATAVSYAKMPSAPFNPVAFDTGEGNSLQVSWSSVFDPDFDYYMLYYGTDPENLNSSVVVMGNSYTLNGLTTGQTYYLKVTAVSTSGDESLPVNFSGTPNLIPLTPQNFNDMPYLNSVRLLWEANTELDLAGYLIFRSQSPDETGAQITPNPVTSPVLYDYDVVGSPDFYYYYRVCSIDLSGNQSPLSDPVKTRPVTLNSGILIVDETQDFAGTNPLQPSDEQVDQFYERIMNNFQTITSLDLASSQAPLRLADIGIYSSILWHGNDFADMAYPFDIRDALSAYMSMGGKLLYTGYHPTTGFALNTTYPATFDPTSYLSSVLGIASTDYNVAARFRYANPRVNGFPQLTVDNDKTTANLNGHLFHIESLHATTNATNIYSYGSDYGDETNQGQFNGDPIAIMKNYDQGKAIILSFPLYNMLEPDARALVNHVLHNIFMEPSSIDDPTSPALQPLSLGQNYPNPFSSNTKIPLKLANKNATLQISIFNLKGQRVRTLSPSLLKDTEELIWDGKDDFGNDLSTGIYYIQAKQGKNTAARKLMLIK